MKTLTLLFGLLCTGVLTAQSDSLLLAQRLTEYQGLTQRMQVDSLLEYIDPKLFELVPREAMKAQFDGIFNGDDMRIGFNSFEIDRIGQVQHFDSTDYALIAYTLDMSMEMISEAYRDSSSFSLTAALLEGQYADGAVTADLENFRIDIVAPKMMLALRHAPEAPFYFIEYDPANEMMTGFFVPAEIQDKLTLD